MSIHDLLLLHVTLFLGVAPLPAEEPAGVAAAVCWLEGEATRHTPTPQTLALLDLLPAGTEIETAAGAELTLVFADGRRSVLAAASRARVEPGGLNVLKGSARNLEPVPAAVALSRLDPVDDPGRRPGAARIRGTGAGAITVLAPRNGEVVLAESVVLRFTAAQGTESYRVEVSDAAGRPVFTTETIAGETTTLELTVPFEVLAPATSYFWRVRRPSGQRWETLGSAVFTTLSAAAAETRRQLGEQIERGDDPSLRLLRAGFDQQHGLTREACADLAGLRTTSQGEALERLRGELGCEAAP